MIRGTGLMGGRSGQADRPVRPDQAIPVRTGRRPEGPI